MVEAGIYAGYVPICVVKPIGVDAKSGNISGSHNWVKGHPGAK